MRYLARMSGRARAEDMVWRRSKLGLRINAAELPRDRRGAARRDRPGDGMNDAPPRRRAGDRARERDGGRDPVAAIGARLSADAGRSRHRRASARRRRARAKRDEHAAVACHRAGGRGAAAVLRRGGCGVHQRRGSGRNGAALLSKPACTSPISRAAARSAGISTGCSGSRRGEREKAAAHVVRNLQFFRCAGRADLRDRPTAGDRELARLRDVPAKHRHSCARPRARHVRNGDIRRISAHAPRPARARPRTTRSSAAWRSGTRILARSRTHCGRNVCPLRNSATFAGSERSGLPALHSPAAAAVDWTPVKLACAATQNRGSGRWLVRPRHLAGRYPETENCHDSNDSVGLSCCARSWNTRRLRRKQPVVYWCKSGLSYRTGAADRQPPTTAGTGYEHC